MNKFGIIVDGYSSGKFYLEYFKEKGIICLHLQSKINIPEFVKGCFCSGGYDEHYVNQNIEQTIDWISTYGIPEFIIPGCEIGVNLADELNDHFELPLRNPLINSKIRRDKFLMHEALEKAGLRSIQQGLFSSSKDALNWIIVNDIKYPLVVKPINSTSGDGFHLCSSFEEIEEAFVLELYKENLLNIENKKLIVQEYIKGQEYVIDTVSCNKQVTFTDIIKYQKRIGKYRNTVYEQCEFLNLHSLDNIQEYVLSVLNTLGIEYGPAHTEIIVDEKGPVLIECGARLAGCMLDLQFIKNIYGHNQLELAGLLYTNVNEYLNRVSQLNHKTQQYSSLVLFAPKEKGIIQELMFEPLNQLDCVYKVDLSVKVGQEIDEPKNLSEVAAIIYLQGKNQQEVGDLAVELINSPQNYIKIS